MTNTAHTPGPWFYDKAYDRIIAPSHSPVWCPEKGFTSVVCLFGAMGGDDTDADARLIAAAPELLEALRPFAMIAKLDAFYRDNSKDRMVKRTARCKSCMDANLKKYISNNREAANAKRRAYYHKRIAEGNPIPRAQHA